MTTKELIEYLQGFPPEEDVSMIVIDASRERKYAFKVQHLSLITGEAFPQIWLHIDKEAPVDVTRKEGEEDGRKKEANTPRSSCRSRRRRQCRWQPCRKRRAWSR